MQPLGRGGGEDRIRPGTAVPGEASIGSNIGEPEKFRQDHGHRPNRERNSRARAGVGARCRPVRTEIGGPACPSAAEIRSDMVAETPPALP